ncbi:MAG: hypothetical protein AB7O26_14510, partial [Planctomycetaceae bacterium]
GTLTYAIWRVAEWDWLVLAGMLTILVGLFLSLIGCVSLLLYLRQTKPVDPAASRKVRQNALIVAGLLCANYPAAAFCFCSAIEVSTRYYLQIENHSGTVIESCVVRGPGVEIDTGPIAQDRVIKRILHFQHDGKLEFGAKRNNSKFGGTVDDYVSNGLGGRAIIRLMPNDQFQVDLPRGY